ncbi:MAG TPA: hypothetical protein VF228_03890 [Iamia sp.]
MPQSGDSNPVEQLVDVLQKERDRLEQLRYRFVALGLMLDAREVRFWGWALQDLNRARLRVRETDLMRAATVGTMDVASARGGVPSLREVASATAAPWAGILRDHHDSLCTVVTEIELHAHHIAEEGRACLAELARTGTLGPPAEAPRVLVGPADGGTEVPLPTPRPRPTSPLRAPGQADDLDPVSIECLLSDLISGGGRMRIPALLAFLR